MRPWALPILGAVAFSLAIPSGAEARLRFGPGAVLGAFAGAMFGGFRHVGRHHQRRAVMHASARPRSGARFDRRTAGTPRSVATAPQPPTNPPQMPSDTSAEREKIDRAVEPNASQRDALEELRGALARGIERIATSCPAAMPVGLAQRLNAIQDRIWAMHDALLTIRLPFERFHDALSEEQRQRLRGEAPQPANVAANATEGRSRATAEGRGEMCLEPSAGLTDWMMRTIERAAPHEQQRAGVETMRMRSAEMARLVAASCPSDPRPDAMSRVAAATDRLQVMLFTVMSVSPMLQQFYDSLDDKQKAGLARALRQARR